MAVRQDQLVGLCVVVQQCTAAVRVGMMGAGPFRIPE